VQTAWRVALALGAGGTVLAPALLCVLKWFSVTAGTGPAAPC
jgi:hypothetical protein